MPKENYWYSKNRISKDLYMESEKDVDDSFAKGMDDLNKYADQVFKSDLRALRAKEALDRQVQERMNAQILTLQQT